MYRQPAVSATPVPQFGNASAGFRVRHREYLGDIKASAVAGQFTIQQYAINPGLFASFPWLCSIASQYDKWKPNGIVVCINSLSSTYSGTSSLGTVAVATDYDVLDAPYANKVEMENSQFATSGNTSQSLLHPIECKQSLRSQNMYKVRFGEVASSDNLRFYDHCNVYVATSGCTANQVVAELWISYDITLYYPQLAGGLLGRTLLNSYFAGAGPSNGTPFGTLSFDPTSAFTVTASGASLTFPSNLTAGTFYVTAYFNATTVTINNVAPTYTSGCIAGPTIAGGLPYLTVANGGNFGTYSFTITLTGNFTTSQTVTLPTITFTGSPGVTLCSIYQVNPTIHD